MHETSTKRQSRQLAPNQEDNREGTSYGDNPAEDANTWHSRTLQSTYDTYGRSLDEDDNGHVDTGLLLYMSSLNFTTDGIRPCSINVSVGNEDSTEPPSTTTGRCNDVAGPQIYTCQSESAEHRYGKRYTESGRLDPHVPVNISSTSRMPRVHDENITRNMFGDVSMALFEGSMTFAAPLVDEMPAAGVNERVVGEATAKLVTERDGLHDATELLESGGGNNSLVENNPIDHVVRSTLAGTTTTTTQGSITIRDCVVCTAVVSVGSLWVFWAISLRILYSS